MSKRARFSEEPLVSDPVPAMTLDSLEPRRLMSVGPATIANATVNDCVYDVAAGKLHVIYYDVQKKTLNYQAFNANGTADAPQVVDNSGDTGQYLSLARDPSGQLHAAYYDAVNRDLKYARRDVSGTWSNTTLDSKNTTGLYPSIAIDSTGYPIVSYYYKSAGDLRVAWNWRMRNHLKWDVETAAADGDVGRYSSVAINPASHIPAIAYEDSTRGHIRYCEHGGVIFDNHVTVDSAIRGGAYLSLNFRDGNPAVSYYDAYNADLKYAERSGQSAWSAQTVASEFSQGLYTDLAWTYDTNQPAIVYYDKSHDSVVLAYRTPASPWNFEVETTGGGRNVSVADGASTQGGVPDLFLVYTDTASGHLKVSTV